MKKQLLTFITLAIGVMIGASALSALAANTNTWTAPLQSPPGGNVDAPINVGGALQEKQGPLLIDSNFALLGTGIFRGNTEFYGNVKIATGTPVVGQVLTAIDSAGTVAWKDKTWTGSPAPTSTPVYITENGPGTVYAPLNGCSRSGGVLSGCWTNIPTTITFTAQPPTGVTFTGWGQDCSGNSLTCTLLNVSSGPVRVTANFTNTPSTPYTFELSTTNSPNVTILKNWDNNNSISEPISLNTTRTPSWSYISDQATMDYLCSIVHPSTPHATNWLTEINGVGVKAETRFLSTIIDLHAYNSGNYTTVKKVGNITCSQ